MVKSHSLFSQKNSVTDVWQGSKCVYENKLLSIDFECDFQDDLCGCDLSSNGQFKWRRGKGGTPSILTGPNQDRFETSKFY